MTTPPDRDLAAYLEDEVTASQRAVIDRALAASAPARARLDELSDVVARLRGPCDDSDRTDLVPAIRDALAREPAPPRRSRWRPFAAVAAAAALIAIAGTAVLRDGDRASEFSARSAASSSDPDRWVDLQVYVAHDDAAPRPLGPTVRAGDGFLFGYTASGSAGHYLMVMAISADREVRWFYPDHADPAADPTSIRIEPAAGAELPDQIEHELPAGPLAIYALFTAEPLSVSAVEAAVARAHIDPAAPGRLPVPDSAQHIVRTQVVR